MTTAKPTHITVVKPGWLTTVQDLGRYGSQQYGVPVSGAMDRYSYIVANRLIGNSDHDAALEVTIKGPELLFERDSVIAVTGADLTPSINDIGIPLWTSLPVNAGSRLTFGARRAGARGYLAVAGGIEVPVVMGSRSTHLSSRTGGMNGRALAQGDILVGGQPFAHQRATIGRSLPEKLRPVYSMVSTLRIVPGPQRASFSKQALEVLTTNPYRLSSQSDRTGYRLEGPALAHAGERPWISDGTAMGALQVPPDEQPILLMADRHTTGGYPKIAVVVSADLRMAGQLMPGETVRFQLITLPDAQALMNAQWNELRQALPLQITIENPRAPE
ncbi:MAG: putative hydrolase subunit [Nitrospirota bacterium]|jgi:antagonist of KipI